MKRAKVIKTVIIMTMLVGCILLFYLHLTRRNTEAVSAEAAGSRAVQEMTTAQKLIAEAPFKEYPTTPVQLVKYYNDLTVCLYNEDCTEDEQKALVLLLRKYMDEDLLTNQTEADQLIELRKDVAAFKQQEIRIYSVDVTPSLDVKYFTYEEYECARLYSNYTMKGIVDGSMAYNTIRQVFILRRNEEGHWKIYGYKNEEETGDIP
ncbi:MAG: hypothetical protein IKO10_11960 [Lachnospiraceae bacterium]|nr:hypothetical protein [Lachnospiraceae bacterium]